MKRPARLGTGFEPLEDRSLPSTFGIPWADPGRLTLSFAPDGTGTPTGPSTLSQTMAAAGPAAAWEREVLRAFQSWAAVTNINVGVAADGGQSLGTLGAVQGDARFGDLRVAAAPNPDDTEVAAASPFGWTGTTFGGDVVFNNAAPYSLGNVAGMYDLYSVAVHEAGHALGLAHSTATDSVMQADYGYRTGLGASDVAAVRALYGVRSPDAYDAAVAGGNDAMSRATALPSVNGQLVAAADIGTAADVDYFKFGTPLLTATLSSVVVRVKASGISLLTPSLTVYDAAGRVVGSASTTDPLNNDLTVRFTPGLLGGTYYAKVTGAAGSPFGVGGYKVAADFLSLGGVLAPITNTVLGVLDGHTNDTLATALNLAPHAPTDQRFDATYRGVIEDATDKDTYRVWTNSYPAGTPVNLDVIVWGTDATPVNPRVAVFDAAGRPVAVQVLSDDTGLFSLQLPDAVAGQSYYVQVAARTPGGAGGTGGYFLGADFNRSALVAYDAAGGGALAAGATASSSVTVTRAALFQFALAADAGSAVTMTVLDSAGNAVFSLTAAAGQPPVTTVRYLPAGAYTVRYTAAASGPVTYDLYLLQLSDPVGPYKTTTSSQTTATSPPPPPPDTTTTTAADPGADPTVSDDSYWFSATTDTSTASYGYTY
jgi:hypothetical protein